MSLRAAFLSLPACAHLLRGEGSHICENCQTYYHSQGGPRCQMTRSAGNPHVRESPILAPVRRPRMKAAGLQCLLRLLFPTPKSAHFPVWSFHGKSDDPNMGTSP